MSKKQNLTTFLGRVIDKMSYGKIASFIVGVLLFCATYFWILNPFEQGTDEEKLNWLNALYYSIITFSSLGYGDIAPVGFGKVVASIEVLSGIILSAIFIGKIASERQSAILRLIYTSEHQRRLVEFEKEMEELKFQLDRSLTEHNHEKLYSLSHSIYRFIASMHNYLFFQSNHGDLATAGNTAAFRRLYNSLDQMQQTVYDAIRSFGIQQRTKSKFIQVITRINNIATSMIIFHNNDLKIHSLLNEILQTKTHLDKWNEQSLNGQLNYKFRNDLTDYLLNQVKERLPKPPWPKNVHKKIAEELEIQNRLAQKCIAKLIEDGY
jgi:hypothetical protein